MKSQRIAFIVPFAAAGGLVWRFVTTDDPRAAIIAGVGGILVQWLWSSRRHAHDLEPADASYFFGFLLTLVFLAAGLFALGAPGTASVPPNGAVDGVESLKQFLRDLASGLVLTIVGLFVRQIRVLGTGQRSAGDVVGSGENGALAKSVGELVTVLRQRTETEGEAHRSADSARAQTAAAAETLARDIDAASDQLRRTMSNLESAAQSTSGAVLRALSGLSETVTAASERIQIHTSQVLESAARQRAQADESLRQSLAAANELQPGLARFGEAARTFAELSSQVAREIRELPDPSDRLSTLWQNVQVLEASLVESMTRLAEALAALRTRSDEASVGVVAIGRATQAAADELRTDAGAAAEALQREIRQIDALLGEFVGILEHRVAAYPR